MNPTVHVSVRELVEYYYRSGDINVQISSTIPLAEGRKAHQQLQQEQDESYKKEVLLAAEIPYRSIIFHIEGRCDGIIEQEPITIDEIKSTRRDVGELTENDHPAYWGQAKVYAYLYGRKHQVEEMDLQLTYYHVESGETKRLKKSCQFEQVSSYVLQLIDYYYQYLSLQLDWREIRDPSIIELSFPFSSYRQGQRDLAVAVYHTIREAGKLFAKAPTGIGKTISTLFPAIKALGEDKIKKVLYLTAKTITRTVAEETLASLREAGLRIKSATITAKEKICFKEETICQKEYCQFADGYYDRIHDGLIDLFTNEDKWDRPTIEKYARKHQLCPFELSLDISLLADCLICDYNYFFDPRVSFRRLLEGNKQSYALLVDEAHNLVDRAREMYSAQLYQSQILQTKRLLQKSDPIMDQMLSKVNRLMRALKKESQREEARVKQELPQELIHLLQEFVQPAEKWLLTNRGREGYQELLDLYYASQNLIKISRLYDQRYITYSSLEKNDVMIKLFCLDPSFLLAECTKQNKATIFFSATLQPFSYYKHILGGSDQDYAIQLPSPFPHEHLDLRLYSLSTRYKDRQQSLPTLTQVVQDVVKEKRGNYLLFFPSYQYMMQAYESLQNEQTARVDLQCLLQSVQMTEGEKEQFLEQFQAGRKKTLLGFAVLGGHFSEGIDLRGDRLTGVIIVGVGLPQLQIERDLIKSYFNSFGVNGYHFAYVYPGINKVLQAGGRLIRTEQDKGVLVLIDDRYTTSTYSQLLPQEWRHLRRISLPQTIKK